MNRFTIPCTEEQTKKALELGAPIEFEVECPVDFETWERSPYPDIKMGKDGEPILIIPTSEQMIGWLRSKGIQFHFDDETGYWNVGNAKTPFRWQGYSDKKELVAIDAALDFLENTR